MNAFAQFAALLSQEQLEAVGAFWSPSKQRYTAPAITTFHNILAALPPETLDNAIGQWTGQHSTAHAPVAIGVINVNKMHDKQYCELIAD